MPVPTTVAPMSCKKTDGNSSEKEGIVRRLLPQAHGQKESMILVQVNPGETFTIQAENHTQCITGPAQVPMVSPNGAIPPIQVPHGYISQVIEDQHGYRKVVVIPATQPTRFPGGSGTQPVMTQSTLGMPHAISMQPGAHYNYMQQMSTLPISPQLYPSGDRLHMRHRPVHEHKGESADLDQRILATPQPYQFPCEAMDSDSGRSGKVKDGLQRKLHDKRQMHQPDSTKNPSPSSTHSISPSSSSSCATSPSPNSSPDSSPRVISSPFAKHPNGFSPQKKPHQIPVLLSNQDYQITQMYSTIYSSPGKNGYSHSKGTLHARTSDETLPGNGCSDFRRRVKSSSPSHQQTNLSVVPQFTSEPVQYRSAFHSSDFSQVPFPTNDGKSDIKNFLSALTKPEVYDISPRCAWVKWSLQFSPPTASSIERQAIVFEVYLMQKGKDRNQFKLIKRECNNYSEIKDLKPGIEYCTKVLAEFDCVRGEYSDVTLFRTTSCPPDTPGAPKMIHFTKNSLSLRWTPPNDNGEKILKYHLEWDEGEKGSGFRSLFSDNHKQYRVSKLQPSHNYTFRLSCENSIGTSPWSPEVTHRTSGAAPSIPDSPRLSKASVTSLDLFWSQSPAGSNDPSSGYHTRFTLEMDDRMGYGFRVVYDGADLGASVKNLSNNTLHKFRLRAYNSEGRSGYSLTSSFCTLPDKPGPPGKAILKGKAHSTWFKVVWEPPDDDGGSEITKYVLEYTQKKGQQMETIYSGVENEYVVRNVLPGATCRLRVYCVTNGGTSVPSEVSFVCTPAVAPGQCASPKAAMKPTPTILFLRWDPPNYDGGSTITKYELAISSIVSQEVARFEDSLKQVHLGPALDYAVTNLKPGIAYRFAVRAGNRVGMGHWSAPAELKTSPGPPEKVDTPEAENVTSDSILLTWKKPHDNGSEITGYSVEWRSEHSAINVLHATSVLTFNFRHLAPNVVYFFRVQAHNDAGKGSYSDVGTVRTAPSCPDFITNIWQDDIQPDEKYMEELGLEDDEVDETMFTKFPTSAMICWERPSNNGSEITCFMIEISHLISKTTKFSTTELKPLILEADGKDTCRLLQNLQPNSEYRVRIKAVNKIGSSIFSLPFTLKTQPLPPDPPVVECTCSYNSLKLKWGNEESNLTYFLQMREKHGRYITVYNGAGRTYRLNRCMERTAYFFRIYAKNEAGEGPLSDVYCFETAIAPPPQLKNLPCVTLQGDIAEISWECMETVKGDRISYLLNIESDKSMVKQTISLDQNFYRICQLVPACKYRIQVALVRHILYYTGENADMMNATTQSEDLESLDKSSEAFKYDDILAKDFKQEEIIGQFSSWVSFEKSESSWVDYGATPGFKGDVEPSSIVQTATQLLNNAWVRMSDDAMVPVLLTITFFLLAVLVAFLVQLMVD